MTWYQYIAKLLADRGLVLVCSGEGSLLVTAPDSKNLPLYSITKTK